MSIATFLPLFPILLILFSAVLIAALRFARPAFNYYWLIAAAGALFAWPAALLARGYLPQTISLMTWRPEWMFTVSPALLIDEVSWPYAFALCTLCLAVLLADSVRANKADWISWSGALLITALGILSVQAANPLTLLLTWTAIDIVELLIQLWFIPQSIGRERVVIAFFLRIAGVFVLLWADLIARSSGFALEFQSLPEQLNIYFLLAALFRLGTLPLHQTFLQQEPMRRSLGTISRLVTAAASYALLTRLAMSGIGGRFAAVFLPLGGIIALYAAINWMNSRDELEGRPFWVIAFAAFTAASAVRGQTDAAQAWGIAAILAGGLISLFSVRTRSLMPLAFLGLIAISTLPYTPAWQSTYLYAPPFQPVLILYFLAQLFLFVGYGRHALRRDETGSTTDRWVGIIYPWGLGLLLLAHFMIGWLDLPTGISVANTLPSIVLVLTALIFYLVAKRLPQNAVIFSIIKRGGFVLSRIFSLEWLYRALWRVYTTSGKGFTYLFRVIEGEGGILWALLFLVLLVTIMTQAWNGN